MVSKANRVGQGLLFRDRVLKNIALAINPNTHNYIIEKYTAHLRFFAQGSAQDII